MENIVFSLGAPAAEFFRLINLHHALAALKSANSFNSHQELLSWWTHLQYLAARFCTERVLSRSPGILRLPNFVL